MTLKAHHVVAQIKKDVEVERDSYVEQAMMVERLAWDRERLQTRDQHEKE